MATYVRAGLPEVATALATLTREPHPLAIARSLAGPITNGDDQQVFSTNLATLGYAEPGEDNRGEPGGSSEAGGSE
jgi:hypothetical protein